MKQNSHSQQSVRRKQVRIEQGNAARQRQIEQGNAARQRQRASDASKRASGINDELNRRSYQAKHTAHAQQRQRLANLRAAPLVAEPRVPPPPPPPQRRRVPPHEQKDEHGNDTLPTNELRAKQERSRAALQSQRLLFKQNEDRRDPKHRTNFNVCFYKLNFLVFIPSRKPKAS